MGHSSRPMQERRRYDECEEGDSCSGAWSDETSRREERPPTPTTSVAATAAEAGRPEAKAKEPKGPPCRARLNFDFLVVIG